MARMKYEQQAKKLLAVTRPGSRNRSLEAKANAILGRDGFFGRKKKRKKNKRTAMTSSFVEVNGTQYVEGKDGTLRPVKPRQCITFNGVVYSEMADGTLVPVRKADE